GDVTYPASSALRSSGLPEGFEAIPRNVMDQVPVIPGRPESAPIYDPLRQVVTMPWPDACLKMGDRCNCYTADGSRILEIDDASCADVLAKGKVFNPYRRAETPARVAYQQRAAVPAGFEVYP
ncbi:MAG: hypothetical protein PHC51_11865, partial [bacterium]|nr:hypothetical protein [bacterium]